MTTDPLWDELDATGFPGEPVDVCPVCGQSDGYLNVGRVHVGVCHAHRRRWPIGENLFSGWRDETQADWDRNAALLETYRR